MPAGPAVAAGQPAAAAVRRERRPRWRRRIARSSPDSTGREGRGLDAEWLVDNYHIVDDVLREVEKDLPAGYDAELPKLAGEPLAGYPRVYALALALVAHTDGGLDEARLTRFVEAFQSVAPLTIGELWAVPTMLRLVLLENLRRLADQMLRGRAGGAEGRRLGRGAPGASAATGPWRGRCRRSATTPVGEPASAVRGPADRAPPRPGPRRGAGARPARRRARAPRASTRASCSARSTAARPPTSSRSATPSPASASSRRSTGTPSSSANSRVEAILRDDPAGVYVGRTSPPATGTARPSSGSPSGSGVDEVEVARRAVEHARAGAGRRAGAGARRLLPDRRAARAAFKAEFGYRPEGPRAAPPVRRLDHPRLVYFGSIGLLMVASSSGSWRRRVGAGASAWLIAPDGAGAARCRPARSPSASSITS